MLTKPCQHPTGVMCDYAVGFPFPYFQYTDVMSQMVTLPLVLGFIVNLIIWFIIVSFIFNLARRS